MGNKNLIRTDLPATNRKVICYWILNDLEEIGITGVDLRMNITIISYKSIFDINENNCNKPNNLQSLKISKIKRINL